MLNIKQKLNILKIRLYIKIHAHVGFIKYTNILIRLTW